MCNFALKTVNGVLCGMSDLSVTHLEVPLSHVEQMFVKAETLLRLSYRAAAAQGAGEAAGAVGSNPE